jgi:hypothetical protein
MTSREYDSIDELVAAKIKRARKSHPKLGHHGLLKVLLGEGTQADPQDLKIFMEKEGIKAERPWRPWHLVGLPRWMGGSIDYRGTRTRWRLWRK